MYITGWNGKSQLRGNCLNSSLVRVACCPRGGYRRYFLCLTPIHQFKTLEWYLNWTFAIALRMAGRYWLIANDKASYWVTHLCDLIRRPISFANEWPGSAGLLPVRKQRRRGQGRFSSLHQEDQQILDWTLGRCSGRFPRTSQGQGWSSSLG